MYDQTELNLNECANREKIDQAKSAGVNNYIEL